jgi:hypothetical protein
MSRIPQIPLITTNFNPDMEQFNLLIEAINSGFTAVEVVNEAQVAGPASAVDGHLAVFDGVTGKLIKDGGPVPGGGGGAPGPYLARNDATALSAATIVANSGAGNNRYILNSATGVPVTLPFPTGTGTVLEFLIQSMSTSNGYVFDTGVAGAGINPFISALSGRASLTGGAVSSVNVTAAGAHNRITLLNGVAGTGGDVGDVIYITDAISGQYQISGMLTVDTTSATFSAY